MAGHTKLKVVVVVVKTSGRNQKYIALLYPERAQVQRVHTHMDRQERELTKPPEADATKEKRLNKIISHQLNGDYHLNTFLYFNFIQKVL
jgi:hypothetical protein